MQKSGRSSFRLLQFCFCLRPAVSGLLPSVFCILASAFVLASSARAQAPLESDLVVFDGTVQLAGGRAEVRFELPPDYPRTGFTIEVASDHRFSLELNGTRVAPVGTGVFDLRAAAGLLAPGPNRLAFISPDTGSFRATLWLARRAWFTGAGHSHTTHSDGRQSVAAALRAARAAGADFYGLTDHNTLEQCADSGFHPIPGLVPVRGEEWTSGRGHATVLGIEGQERLAVESVPQMVDDATWRGGLVVVNHPVDPLGHRWQRWPELDPGIDGIEVMNSLVCFPPRGDRAALNWWHDILSSGRPVAAVGNDDFHGRYPFEARLASCSRVFAGSDEPDSILSGIKLGRVMACSRNDGRRLYLYADTNDNGRWDVVGGEHVRSPVDARPVRFRLDVAGARPGDRLRVRTPRGDMPLPSGVRAQERFEWRTLVRPGDHGFVYAELADRCGLPRVVTNPVYVNYPGYEVGPFGVATMPVNWPDTVAAGADVPLWFAARNYGRASPYRLGLLFAVDSALAEIGEWWFPDYGEVLKRQAGPWTVLVWRAGYPFCRLAPGGEFAGFITVKPRRPGPVPVHFNSWAAERLLPAGPEAGPGDWPERTVYAR